MVDLTRLPAGVTRAMTGIAVIGFVIAVGVHLATFGPLSWAPWISGTWPLLFFAIFPVAGSAIVVLSFARVPVDVLLGALPAPIKIAGALLTAYVFINFAIFFRTTFGHAPSAMAVARGFTGHTLFFFAAAAIIWYEFDRIRAGKLEVDPAPGDESSERDPLPRPLSRWIVLQSRLSGSECAGRLMRVPRSRRLSLVGGYGLRGVATPEGFRLELGGQQTSMVYAVGRFEGAGPTFIRVLITFKRWILVSFASLVALVPVVAWTLIPVGFAWQGIAFVIVFAGGGNLVFGMAQMRSLQAQIQRATESEPVSIV